MMRHLHFSSTTNEKHVAHTVLPKVKLLHQVQHSPVII